MIRLALFLRNDANLGFDTQSKTNTSKFYNHMQLSPFSPP